MTQQSELIQIVKRKGTGKTMSKPLSSDDLIQLRPLLQSDNTTPATKATLITAFIMLEQTSAEAQWFLTVIKPPESRTLAPDLHALFFNEPKHPFDRILHNLLKHQDLSSADMITGLDYVFNSGKNAAKKAVFLEALRLKEETKLENHTAYDYLLAHSHHVTTALPHVIDLANPYDGFNRNLYSSVFLAPLLGSIGFPCVLHGIDAIGPKNGVNPRKLLQAMNKNAPKSLSEAADQLGKTGWCYVDQSIFSPQLYQQKQLRLDMVKRPLLATLEKLLMPIRGESTHLITGYTHPPYKQKMTDLMHHSPATQGVLFRGVEGSLQLPLSKRVRCRTIQSNTHTEYFISPPPTLDANATPDDCLADSISAGLAAFAGKESPMVTPLLHTGSSILDGLSLMPYNSAWSALNNALQSGQASAHWSNG
ncbi:hypothetical protein CL648_04990 [bacterium]|jgi:anthranilate phosphoribosyltransferase|nr:hypothetical protein [bacterium]|tara:strand:- start:5156 stop:6421 length:1266 start_codon:yes stop_codon:yes gene_type:complete